MALNIILYKQFAVDNEIIEARQVAGNSIVTFDFEIHYVHGLKTIA